MRPGVDVEYTDYADMIHAFLNSLDLERAMEARAGGRAARRLARRSSSGSKTRAQVVERLEGAFSGE